MEGFLNKDFEYREELQEATSRLSEIEILMSANNKKDNEVQSQDIEDEELETA